MNYTPRHPHDMNSLGHDGPPPMSEGDTYYSSCLSTAAAAMNLDDCSSGFQSTSISNFPSELPSSASTTINEYPPQQPPLSMLASSLNAPPPPPQGAPPCMLPPARTDIAPSKVIEELSKYICNENDKVVLTNSLGLLFSYSINSFRGSEVCQLMSESPVILTALYNILTNEHFRDDDPILFLATCILTNISKYESGRAAILGCNGLQDTFEWPSRGVSTLINLLQSRDCNVVIFSITAVHNLLLDRRIEIQEIAKKQIKDANGIHHIVRQLANQYLVKNYEFKVIVLDCLQIMAYGNMANRLTILESGGPKLLLTTIDENFDNQPTEELVETASRVLKSLSACAKNKEAIIKNDGIQILTRCIKRDNQEILKTCLWTLRNLSDVIILSERRHSSCINELIERLLGILMEYENEPCIVTCALGTLANLTCNNEPIKQLICHHNGIERILNTIEMTLRDTFDFRVVNNEILEPAVCALCHLLNQLGYPDIDLERQRIRQRFEDGALNSLRWVTSEDLKKAVEKLLRLLSE